MSRPSGTVEHDAMLTTAVEAVAEACGVARLVQHDLERVGRLTKDDRSPVTVADFAVQAIIAIALRRGFGEVHLVGEESAASLRDPANAALLEEVVTAVRRYEPDIDAGDVMAAIDAGDHDGRADGFWTLDPVDGTKGFLRGQQYAIALARIEGGEVQLGVMGCPNLAAGSTGDPAIADAIGTVFAATRGGGAWAVDPVDPTRRSVIHATTTRDGATVRLCESVESSHTRHDHAARILEHLGYERTSVQLDSQAKYAVVARGQSDLYLRMPTSATYVEKIWDHAAGALIATEAGAIVTDITGRDLEFSHGRRLEKNRGVVCAAPDVHARVIEAIGALGLSSR
ncbi:MAG: 3'(2'),5'-bisphosphate nucleotidase [Phycisphaerales bacterium]|nr:3'(2'),5'-bisphosphate nucleotidase [Phycisphaerales bacterium]